MITLHYLCHFIHHSKVYYIELMLEMIFPSIQANMSTSYTPTRLTQNKCVHDVMLCVHRQTAIIANILLPLPCPPPASVYITLHRLHLFLATGATPSKVYYMDKPQPNMLKIYQLFLPALPK